MEEAPWFQERLTESHEEQATAGLVAMWVTGGLAGGALASRRRPRLFAWLSRGTVAGLAVGAILIGLAACTGGQIRHDEVRPRPRLNRREPGRPSPRARPVGALSSAAASMEGAAADG